MHIYIWIFCRVLQKHPMDTAQTPFDKPLHTPSDKVRKGAIFHIPRLFSTVGQFWNPEIFL